MTPLRLFCTLALLLASLPITPAAAAPSAQLRAYWVDAFGPGLYSPAEIDQVVAETKAANLNAIVAQVVRRADCFCNRSSAPRTDAPVAPFPFDPLQTLIERAHAQGLEVHAWVIVTGMWRGATPPPDPRHVFNSHGPSAGAESWTTQRSDGLDRLGDEVIFDPGHPDAADYMVGLATSIVANYDVDGLNLDRIRYPDGNLGSLVPSWGYNPTALARFQAATGRGDRPAPQDAQWTQWRRDQITSLVRKIYVQSYALRPRVRVSADTISYGHGPQAVGGWERTRSYAEQLQDWRGWLAEGILDLNVTMNYKRDALADQRAMFDEWSAFTKDNQYRRQGIVGPALYLNDVTESLRQAREALAPSSAGAYGAGWVGYSYRTPDAATNAGTRDGASARAELTRGLTQPSATDPSPVFASPAPVPAMPWKSQPTTGHVSGTARDASGAPIVDRRVELADDASGALLRAQTTDGRGWFAFVDLAPGRYRASVSGASATTSLVAGQLATVSLISGAPQCTPTYGPWIHGPASVPSSIPGFHAVWYGQSGYATLCPGMQLTGVVSYYNSGSRGWVLGKMGEAAYLGTWHPEPGQDQATALGGDGQLGSPNTGWPRYNRIAVPTTEWVGPKQVGWFRFTLQAPATPGTYRLSIRPLIEGTTWMEDYGVFWYVTVK